MPYFAHINIQILHFNLMLEVYYFASLPFISIQIVDIKLMLELL